MKQIYIQNQDQQGNNDASAVTYQLFCSIKSYKLFTPTTTFAIGRRQNGGHDIFLIRNKGKGPPGRTRSPGLAFCPARDNQPLAFNPQYSECCPEHCPEFIEGLIEGSLPEPVEGKNQIKNELQTHIKPNFLTQLNFLIMKKQIFILAFFILATLASISDSYGQSQPSSIIPRPLTGCNDYPLHPLPGKEYQYEVSNPTGDAVTSYTWWATKEIDFLTSTSTANLSNMLDVASGQLIGHSPNYGVATAAATGSTVSITWTPEILAKTAYQGTVGTDPSPTFVVVKADGDCTNNLQVYELDPLKAFTVDITNWDPATNATLQYGETSSSCVDLVRAATYDNTTKTVLMDYGTNTITFEVIAANFVTSWTPLFEITAGLTASQTATIGWAYTRADAQAGNFEEVSASGLVVGDTFSGTTAATTTETTTVNGVSIWVSVIIDNNSYESLAAQPFTLAVDGVDSTGQWDLTAICASGNAADQDDKATQDLLPRPTIQDDTVDPGPTPDTFIPKN